MDRDRQPRPAGPHRRRAARAAAGCVAVLAAALAAREVSAGESLRRSGNADRNSMRVMTPAVAPQDCPAEPEGTVQLGASLEDAPGGQTTRSLPFLVSYAPCRWYLEVSGDGLTQVDAPAGRQRGLADIALVATHTTTFDAGRYGVEPEAELDLPTHGEAGSSRPSGALRLNLRATFGALGVKLTGAAARDGDAPGPGVSRDSRSLAAQLGATGPGGVKTLLTATRVRRQGTSGTTSWVGELDVPLARRLTGIASVGRKHDADGVASTFELDLSWSF